MPISVDSLGLPLRGAKGWDVALRAAFTSFTESLNSQETATNNAVSVISGAVDTNDAAVAATVSSGVSTRAALNSGYGRSLRPGSFGVCLGDSITQAADILASGVQGASWPTFFGLFGGGRASLVNVGIAGDTTAQMLARFDDDVAARGPRFVVLVGGTNDVGQGRAFSAITADIRAIVVKTRGIGAVPVLSTVPPNDDGGRRQAIGQLNAWIRSYASAEGLLLLDFYTVLADPATGNYKTALSSGDGTHPNAAGYIAMGQHASDLLTPILPPSPQLVATDDVDWNNTIGLGCFAGATGSAPPSGWYDGAGAPAGSTISYVTDSLVPGQMLRITQSAAGLRAVQRDIFIGATTLAAATLQGATSLSTAARADNRGTLFIDSGANYEIAKIVSSDGGTPQPHTLAGGLKFAHAAGAQVIASATPGDTMIFTGTVTADSAASFTVDIQMTGGSPSATPMNELQVAVTRGRWYQKFVIPTGVTMIQPRLIARAGSGVVQFGQVGLYNASRLELV